MKKFLFLVLAFASLDSGLAGDKARFCASDFWTTATPEDMDLLKDPDFWCEGHGLRLIHRAVLARTGVFRAFLEKKPILNIPDQEGSTALILAASSKTPRIVNIRLLVGAGAGLDLQNKWGNTALIWAVYRGHSEIAQALVSAGANLNLQNERGDTALILAVRQGHPEIARALIKVGANPDLQNERGDTALIWAAIGGHSEIAQVLVSAGANLNLQNEWGNTALIWAAYLGHPEIAQVLVGVGADLNLQSKKGDTALIWAAMGGHSEIAQVLVGAGADLNLQNKWGQHRFDLGGDKRAFGNRPSFDQGRSRPELAKQKRRHRPPLGGEKGPQNHCVPVVKIRSRHRDQER